MNKTTSENMELKIANSRRNKGNRRRKAGDTSGAAMIIVLCILAIFLALSVSILLAGSVALNTARNNITYEQGKIQAVTLSDLIVNDMKSTASIPEGDTLGIQSFLKQKIKGGWTSYDPDGDEAGNSAAVCTYKIETGNSEGREYPITLEMYWQENPQNADAEGELKYDGASVWITVKSEMRSPGYEVQCEFALSVMEAASASGGYEWSWTYKGRE